MEDARIDETKAEAARIEGARVEDQGLEEARAEDLEEIDTIIAELEVSKGKGNLILCVVNAPAYRDGIIRALSGRFKAKVIPVEEGEDVIKSLKSGDFSGAEVLIWTMPEKLTEDLSDALNNFRELFYDAGVPSLVFSSQGFLHDVIRRAPDFWRYRGNYHELKGLDRGLAFEAIEALSTSLHYQSEADLLRRKRINEHLLEKVKDEKEITIILDELGEISYLLGEYDKASDYYNQELKISEEVDDKSGVASSLHNLGLVSHYAGDLGEARRLYAESLKIAKDLDDKRLVTISLHSLGILAQDTGDVEDARLLYEESLKIAKELGDKSGVASSLHQLGMLAQATGDLADARRLYGESLKIKQELRDKFGFASTFARTALLEEHEGNLEKALDLIREAEALFMELESPMAEQAGFVRERLEKKIAVEKKSEENEM